MQKNNKYDQQKENTDKSEKKKMYSGILPRCLSE